RLAGSGCRETGAHAHAAVDDDQLEMAPADLEQANPTERIRRVVQDVGGELLGHLEHVARQAPTVRPARPPHGQGERLDVAKVSNPAETDSRPSRPKDSAWLGH